LRYHLIALRRWTIARCCHSRAIIAQQESTDGKNAGAQLNIHEVSFASDE